jgi:hypothetical protein
MSQQSSIDWLVEKYTIVCGLGSKELMKEHIDRAKKMHEMEIIKTHFNAQPFNATMLHNAEKYYNETFNK